MTTKGDLPKHIFLFILDAVRKDHLSLYGYPRRTSLNLEKLARKADIYPWAFSPSSYTSVSVPSILAAKYPIDLSNHFTGKEFTERDFGMLQKVKGQGYRTCFFTGNLVTSSRYANLNKFFDFFWDELTVKELNRDVLYQKAEVILRAVEDLVAKARGEKLFIVVHLMDSHGPYTPEVEPIFKNDPLFKSEKRKVTRVVNDLFSGVTADLLKKEKVIPRYQLLDLREGPGGEIEDFERNVNEYVARYDMGIYLQDKSLGEFFEFLRKENLYEKACLIITADHGELLGEENIFFSHGIFTHPALVNVPLIIKNPNQKDRKDLEFDFSTKDILPTIMGINGNPEPDFIYSLTAKSVAIIKEPLFYLLHNGDFHIEETPGECLFLTKSFNLESALKNFLELNMEVYFRVFKRDRVGFKVLSPKENKITEDFIFPFLKSFHSNYKFIEDRFLLRLSEVGDEKEQALRQLRDSRNQLEETKKQLQESTLTLDTIYRSRSWRLVKVLKKVKHSLPVINRL